MKDSRAGSHTTASLYPHDSLVHPGYSAANISLSSSPASTSTSMTTKGESSANTSAPSGLSGNSIILGDYSASELAAMGLPGVPRTARGVRKRAGRASWNSYLRPREDGPPERVYPLATLPKAAQVVLVRCAPTMAPSEQTTVNDNPATDVPVVPEAFRRVADERSRLVELARRYIGQGLSAMRAYEEAVAGSEHSVRSLRRWEAMVRGVPRAEWSTVLLPRGGQPANVADCHAEAWAYIKSDYLRASKPAWSACYRRLMTVAAKHGWAPIPHERTLRRRLEAEVAATVLTYHREGVEAVGNLYPAQERDRSMFCANQAVNADGHRFDVMVLWPDGKEERPILVGFQDLYSGKLLAWRIDRSETADLVRLTAGDLCSNYGIPEFCYFDNGRAFAAKTNTGGTRTRFRFTRDTAEAARGTLVQLGITVHWCKPYSGRSKPIERAWRDLCEHVAKHPSCSGAYTGNSVVTKPHDYGTRAIPLDEFVQIVAAQVAEHNARTGREARICAGRSFDETFAESYARSVPRKLTEAQHRILFLASTQVRIRKSDGAIHLFDNRYWGEDCKDLRGAEVVVRYDSAALHDGLYVYHPNGDYIGHAPVLETTGFADTRAARDHARAKSVFAKAIKKVAEAEKTFTDAELGRLHLESQGIVRTPEAPTTTVVRPVFGLGQSPAVTPKVEPTSEEHAKRLDQDTFLLDVGNVAKSGLQRRRQPLAANE